MKVEFGTDGIRGRAGEFPCNADVATALGRAVVQVFGARRVLIARDSRASGPGLEAAVAAGVTGEGADVALAGVLPTSAVAVGLAAKLGDIGIMLTASHNPPDDNGFKVLGAGGRKLTDDENRRIEAAIEAGIDGSGAGTVTNVAANARRTYCRAVERVAPYAQLAERRLVLDLANGAAAGLADWLAELLPNARFIGVYGRANDGVGSEHPEALSAAIRTHGAEGGFALDGDGDRCRIFDETGAPIDGDALGWLLALGGRTKAMAVTVMSSTAVEAHLPEVRIVRTPVGDKHLAAVLAGGQATLGVEESGHVLFHDALPTGDGLVTGIRALAYAWARSERVSDAVAGFRSFPRRLTKVKVSLRVPLTDVPAIADASAAGEAALGPKGRVFLRYSGTEPVLRVLVEGPDAAVVERVSSQVTQAATAALA